MNIPIIKGKSDRPILTEQQWKNARRYAEKFLPLVGDDQTEVVVPVRMNHAPKILTSPNEPVPGEHALVTFPIRTHHASGERFLGEGEVEMAR